MGIRDKWRQFKATAMGLFHQPAMIGKPPSVRTMWYDEKAHAVDFSKRYAEPIDRYVTVRMEELHIPTDRIRSSDHDHGIDAIIAHEISEADHATHEAALRAASRIAIPITHRAREILRAMKRGWKGR